MFPVPLIVPLQVAPFAIDFGSWDGGGSWVTRWSSSTRAVSPRYCSFRLTLSVGIGVVKSGGVVTFSAARVSFLIDNLTDHDVGVITMRVSRKETGRPPVTFCSRQSMLNVFAPAAAAT